MYRILELAPVLIPLIGAALLYTYRRRLSGAVLGVALIAAFMGLVSGGLGFVGDNLTLFAQQSAHHLEEMLALWHHIALALTWLCLLSAALMHRNQGSAQ